MPLNLSGGLTATVLALGSVILAAQPAAPALSFSPMQAIASHGTWYIASADFNNDGFPDLVTADGFGSSASVLLNNGDGTFERRVLFVDPERDPVVTAAAGDFNDDGWPDVAVTTYHLLRNELTVTILVGNGDGTFTQRQTLAAARDRERPLPGERSLAVGDLVGDRRLSLVVQGTVLTVFRGNGDGTFQGGQAYAAGLSPRSVVIGDFNGDLLPDVAVSNAPWFQEGSVTILPGIGSGQLGAPVTTLGFRQPVAMTAADVNADGTLDVLTTAEHCPMVFNVACFAALSIGVGDATFEPLQHITFDVSVLPPDLTTAPSPRGVAVGDFNRDTVLDLVIAVNNLNSPARDDIYVAAGLGGGSFSALPTRLDAGVSPITPIVADFNLDGWPDIAVALPGRGVGVFLNTTGK